MVPLNVFQRVMRQWERVHPYNGAQAFGLVTKPHPTLLADAWRGTLIDLGLGRVTTDGSRWGVTPITPDTPVPAVTDGLPIDAHLSADLNRPFGDGAGLDDEGIRCVDAIPFRPFCCHATAGDGSAGVWVGVVYRHWVADSVSVRHVTRRWLARLTHDPLPFTAPLRLRPDGYATLFSPGTAGWPLLPGLRSAAESLPRMKRVRRLTPDVLRTPKAFDTDFRHLVLPSGRLGTLLAYTRRRGIRLGDVFLTTAVDVARSLLAIEPASRRRDGLAGGVVTDLRAAARVPPDTLGLFLGFLTTTYDPSDLASWDAMLARTAAVARDHRQTRAAASSWLKMGVGRLLGAWMARERLIELYRKRLPLVAGVSNVDLDRGGFATAGPTPQDAVTHDAVRGYLRASPCGPGLPVVLTPTTLGGRMTLGVTARGCDVDAVTHAVAQRLASLRD